MDSDFYIDFHVSFWKHTKNLFPFLVALLDFITYILQTVGLKKYLQRLKPYDSRDEIITNEMTNLLLLFALSRKLLKVGILNPVIMTNRLARRRQKVCHQLF